MGDHLPLTQTHDQPQLPEAGIGPAVDTVEMTFVRIDRLIVCYCLTVSESRRNVDSHNLSKSPTDFKKTFGRLSYFGVTAWRNVSSELEVGQNAQLGKPMFEAKQAEKCKNKNEADQN